MKFKKYHFHIYFEPLELDKVQDLIERLKELENISIGRVWNKPVGPHPVGSCQITVLPEKMHEVFTCFLEYRNGLSIFVHPVSGDDWIDHTKYVMWIGDSYRLNLEFFKN